MPPRTSHARLAAACLLLALAATLLGLWESWVRALLVVAPFFSRIAPAQVLESQPRSRIAALLRERPGLGISDVRDALGIGWGTAVHHLNLLERAGHVVSRDSGRHRRFFLAQEPPERRTAVCVLSHELSRRLLFTIHAKPQVSQTELCHELGLSAPLAHKAIGRLQREGLVTSVREWRTVRYSVAPAGQAVVLAARTSEAAPGTLGLAVPA